MKLVLILVFIIGFFLRGQELLSGNFLFLKDQGRDMLAVKSIVVDRLPTLIGPYTGLEAVFQGPLYYYLLAVPFYLFQGNPWGVMLLLMIFSLCAIYIGFIIAKRFFGAKAAGITAFLFATSPALGAAATFIWSPFFLIPISAGYLYFLLLWVNGGGKRAFLGLSLCLGLMYHFELAFAVPFTLVTLVATSYVSFTKKIKWYPVELLLTLLLLISPLLLFDLRHDFLTSRSIVRLATGHTQGLAGTREPYEKIVRDHSISFVSNINASFVEHGSIPGIVSILFLVWCIWYVAYGRRYDIKVLIFLPLLLWGSYLFHPYQIWNWYLVGLFPLYMILFGFALSEVYSRGVGKAIVVVLLIGIAFFSYQKISMLYTNYDYGGTAKIRGKTDAIDAIYKKARGEDFGILVFTPVVLTDAYDYLFWWHGRKQYGFVPTNQKKSVTYLLIEPDPSKPWSYEGWLETVIKDGDIIDTEVLPSGLIVQKRVYGQIPAQSF